MNWGGGYYTNWGETIIQKLGGGGASLPEFSATLTTECVCVCVCLCVSVCVCVFSLCAFCMCL